MLAALAALTITSSAVAVTPASQAKHDRQIVAFFEKRPALARTPAGQLALLRVEVRRLGRMVRTLQSARSTPEGAIRHVFGKYAGEALAVFTCESGLSVWAENGQYLGIAQMGEYARARYGHGPDALTQVRAAYAYFVESGRSWGPWECKPW